MTQDIAIEAIRQEYNNILQQLSDPGLLSNWEKLEELMRQKSRYEKIIAKYDELIELQQKIEENQLIVSSQDEPELTALAEQELKTLKARILILEKETKELFEENREENKTKALIAELRAGVGGEEAALFVADLLKMYLRYAQTRGWKQKVLDSHPTELGGYKEVIFELSGENAYEEMQHEGGVHRVQRIPTTEKGGRVHTSTCSVAILPKPEKTQLKIGPEDLKIDTFRSSGPGGQNVNRRETAVRITHLPTGIVVASQTERNQLQNKENALAILEARLLEYYAQEEDKKAYGTRRSQVKQAKRAEKIRTYNYPQDRITDHRIKKSWHNLENILAGNLDIIIKELQKNEETTGL